MVLGASSMTVGDVMDYVKRQFGDESGVQITDADILRWINLGQVEILNKNPILMARATTSIQIDTREYGLPEDVHSIQTVTVSGRPIQFLNYNEAKQHIEQYDPKLEARGEVEFWYVWASTINVYPTPDATLQNALVVDYYKMPPKVLQRTDVLSVPDRYYSTLLHYVLAQAYEMDEDWIASGNKTSQFEANVTLLAEEENRPRRATYQTITVLDEDL